MSIVVIARAGAHIWNPSPDLTLREADDVIFYGELEVSNLRIRPLIRQTIEARMTSPKTSSLERRPTSRKRKPRLQRRQNFIGDIGAANRPAFQNVPQQGG